MPRKDIARVEILRYPQFDDWLRCKELALNTVWRYNPTNVTGEWKRKILNAEHSPIRTLMFTIKMTIPYYVSVHFVRHKYGVEHYVTSQRNDRQDKYDRNAARQDAIVVHIMDINAQSLINMARKRLCSKADPTTKLVMQMIKDSIDDVCPEIADIMLSECEYRGGKCHEFVSCREVQNE